MEAWCRRQILSVQHGDTKGRMDPWLGSLATGPEQLTDDELASNRNRPLQKILARPLHGQFYRDRSPNWSRVMVLFLSAANWDGYGLHLRGDFEAFTRPASTQKWREAHQGRHEEWSYLELDTAWQKAFA